MISLAKMSVGIIGAGRQGYRRANAISESGDRILKVADIDSGAAQRLADRFGGRPVTDWRDIVSEEDIDTVVVCTPNDTHAAVTIAALRAGKNVLCEKPLARNVAEAGSVMRAVRRNRARLKCGFNLRFHPAISQAREKLAKGTLGELLFIRCRYGIVGRPGYEKDWRANRSIAGGGQLMDQGIHLLDLLRWFAGDFNEVFGFNETLYWPIKPLEDNAFALLRSQSGLVGSVHASWTQWKNLFSMEIFGRNGSITVDGLGGSYGDEKLILCKKDFDGPFREETTLFTGEDRSWYEEWKHFSAAVARSRPFNGGAYDGWAAVRLAYALYESSRTHRSVRLSWPRNHRE